MQPKRETRNLKPETRNLKPETKNINMENPENKTKEQFLVEIDQLRAKIAELEKSESEHKKVEKTLKESEERYKGIIQSTASCIAVYKPIDRGKDFVFVDFNPMAEKVDQISKEEVIGKKVTEVFPGVVEFGLFTVFQNVLKTGKPEHFPVSVYQDERIQGFRENYVYKLSSGEIIAVYQDLTERKQAEEALKESEEIYHGMIHNLMEGFYSATLDGKLLLYNTEFIKTLGLDPINDYKGLELPNFWQDPAERKIYVEEFVRNGFIKNYIVNAKKSDGEKIIVRINSRLIKSEEGKPMRIEGTFLDITEHKKAEKALKENEDNLRTLFNAMTDIVFEMDYDGRYVNIAPTSQELLFKPSVDTIGKTLHEVFPKPEADKFLEFIRKCLDENKINTIEYPLIIKDKTIWFEGRATPKTKNTALYIARDITERKQAEEELTESLQSERFWADIVRNASVGVAISYPDGHLGMSNVAYKKITGYSEKELQTTDWNKILTPPEWEESETAKLQELHRTKKFVKYEKEYIRKDGSRVPVELLVHPRFDSDGNIECYFAFVIDITERKQAENEVISTKARLEHLIAKSSAIIYSSAATEPFGATYISENVSDIIGFKPSDFLEYPGFWANRIHPDDSARVFRELPKIFEVGYHNHEYRWKKKDGSYIWIFDELRLVYDKNGAPIKMVGTWLDITERKQAEDELRKSQKAWIATFDAMTDWISLIDPYTHTIVNSNKTGEEVVGLPVNEIIGNKCYKLVDNSEEPHPDCPIPRILKSKIREETEIKLSEDGPLLLVSVDPVLNENKEIVNVVHIVRDITDRKQAEDTLRESEAKYRRVSDNSPAVLYQFMMTSEGETSFPYVSDVVETILGVPAEDIMKDQSKFIDIVHPDDLKMFQEGIMKSAETLESFPLTFRCLKDEEVVWVEANGVPTHQINGSIIWDGFLLDITKRKHAEDELKKHRDHLEEMIKERTKELETKNKELDNALKVFVGRELTIRDLQKRIRAFEGK